MYASYRIDHLIMSIVENIYALLLAYQNGMHGVLFMNESMNFELNVCDSKGKKMENITPKASITSTLIKKLIPFS